MCFYPDSGFYVFLEPDDCVLLSSGSLLISIKMGHSAACPIILTILSVWTGAVKSPEGFLPALQPPLGFLPALQAARAPSFR